MAKVSDQQTSFQRLRQKGSPRFKNLTDTHDEKKMMETRHRSSWKSKGNEEVNIDSTQGQKQLDAGVIH